MKPFWQDNSGVLYQGDVLAVFVGSGTTCMVAKDLGYRYIGIDLSPEYLKIAVERLRQEVLF